MRAKADSELGSPARLDLCALPIGALCLARDGFIACFDGPARATRCARGIQAQAQELGVDVRAGLHTGECEQRGDDLAGIAVHIAARVAALAKPGDALCSRTVTDLVAGSGITFSDRGRHTLKGIPGRWHTFAVESA